MFHIRMTIGLLLAITGLIGSIAPILPGVILSLAGMLLVDFATGSAVDFSLTTWIIVGVLIVAAIVSDYLFPLIGAKKGGGTKAGTRGSIVGMIAGFLAPPWGLIIGPIIGAFIGEYIIKKNLKNARKAARGSFLGSTASTIVKLIAAGFVVWYIVAAWV